MKGEFMTYHRNLPYHKKITYLINAVLVSAGIAMTIIAGDSQVDLRFGNGNLGFTFKDVPLLLVSGIGGVVPGLVCVLSAFIARSVTDIGYAYSIFAFLVASICTSHAVKRGALKKRLSSFTLALVLTFVLGVFWWNLLVLASINNIENYDAMSNISFIVATLPECVVSVFLLRLLYTKLPDSLKLFLPLGRYYVAEFDVDKERKSVISKKVTSIIVGVSLIICLSAVGFVNYLLPTLDAGAFYQRGASQEGAEGEALLEVLEKKDRAPEKPEGNTGIDFAVNQFGDPRLLEHKFHFNLAGIAFDAKLLMMLLNVVIPIGVFANYFAQRTIAKPITGMSRAMEVFYNEKSDLTMEERVDAIHRLRIESKDEIGNLYRSIEKAADASMYFVQTVQEEQRLEEDLRVAQKASEAKSTFLSAMSHEIRTPINAVLGMDEMILREYDDPTLRTYAVNIQNAAKSLLSLVNEILDFSKLEAGKMEILPVQYDLSSLINDLVNMISVKARDKGLELIVEVDETMPYLLIGDDVRLKQVILNVLTNAVKYTEKGSVTMRVEGKKADDQNIYFHVCIKDTGIGIKEEDIQKLFSPFERIEESRNRTIEGTGLGMSIVKQLLAMMDSKLEVQSVYGEGSEFSFTVRQQVVDWKPIGNYAVKYRESVASMERYQEAFHAPTAKILVTDDTEMNLTVLKGLLKATRIQVDTATGGKETLEKAKQQKYDVMFIDHRMPEMDGIETLAALKTLEGNLNLNTPCISLTANAVSGARETYMKAGFQDYMTKPVDGRKLEELLLRYLPEEKVEKVTAKQINAEDEKALPEHAGTQDPELQVYSGIELDTALQNCGSKEVLLQVIEEFALGIEKKAAAIEEYEKAKDYKNYTVLVHALKSSARLIGAIELSEMAAELESLGNEEKEAEIKEKTPKLLEVYRGYREHLAAALPKEVNPEEDTRELLSEEMWQEVMQGLKEFLEAFDFDSADSAFAMLADYRIPEAHKERYIQLKEGLAAVDRDGLLELMES